MKSYECKPGCGCPSCNPANRVSDASDPVHFTKTLKMVNELAAAKATPEVPGLQPKPTAEESDALMREMKLGPYKFY
ncbi:hypothetical protein EJ069_10290 [Mesorhizobium sp. M2A.F.Ca.ET.043.05.1.1]|uniref:hypothetical protein n=1 Tax=Mesorhizobium sp. M2A.F.Ca.ET.043.05.1.1 TaxID=2493671 RepID=UPI000F756120|nr:hypothetical protein [Mesorhizobium sp. M2A.F.Ca.ET.043.05.1.1]AZO15083.1 hypothetical protein EJ069_10290 [Mesorhizobium sp. M2A.F.Ca.ET.043.05.1.1]